MSSLLRANDIAPEIYNELTTAIADFKRLRGRAPSLATVLVGKDPASEVYVRKKAETCAHLGMGHVDIKLDARISQTKLLGEISTLNNNKDIDGILVQKPLPDGLSEQETFDAIDPNKDVDCFSPENVGRLAQGRPRFIPCTPAGILELLQHAKIDISGKTALVVGRSEIVGKPIAQLLLARNATVIIAHSKTKNLPELVSIADVVIAAIGRPKFLGTTLPWKPTATVVDVGINRLGSKLVGDVDFNAVSQKVANITPVPGGVGPMTIAMLMVNTVNAAFSRAGLPNRVRRSI